MCKYKKSRGSEVLAYYSDEELADAINMTLLYTKKKMRDSRYTGVIDASDLVHSAMEKLLLGIRAWKPEKGSLAQHLIHTVRSDFSHHIKEQNRRIPGDFSDLEELLNYIKVQSSSDLSRSYSMEELLEAVRQHVVSNGDVVVNRLLKAYTVHGYEHHQNAAIAEYFDLSVNVVNNAKKRLDRLLAEKKKEFEEILEETQ